jgi:DNA-binding CsgD family transcriptional regulator
MSADCVLTMVGEIYGALELPQFRRCLISALARAVPSDWVSLNDIGPDPADLVVVVEPRMTPEEFETFGRLSHQNPLVAHYVQTGNGRPYRISDVVDTAKFHRTELYRDFYEPRGIKHQIAFTLPARRNRLLGVALSRRNSDFSDTERALLDRARPFLVEGYRNAITHSGAPVYPSPAEALPPSAHGLGLTPREYEVLSETAAGRSAVAVGELLSLSPRTVQKHLERAYRKVGVGGRLAATAAMRQLNEQPKETQATPSDAADR